MAKQGIERVVNRVIACLQTYLPGQQHTQDSDWAADDVTKWGTAIVLGHIPNTSYFRRFFLEPNVAPACYVIPAGYDADDRLSSVKDCRHNIEVWFHIKDSHPERGFSRVARTLRAAELALEDKIREGGDVINCRISKGDIGAYPPLGAGALVLWGCLTLTVDERVTRPLGA